MRGKGIGYDTGFFNVGVSTREPFNDDVVKSEMRVIRDDLHCNVVRVMGGNPDRLEVAANHAAEIGLEVWFSPFTCDLNTDEMLALLADCANRAERLRRQGIEVVLVTGAELSLLNIGFLPGETLAERIDSLLAPRQRVGELLVDVPARINNFLSKAEALVRERFQGKITYASIPFEGVDWTAFDFASFDAYRTREIAGRFRTDISAAVARGKPVAITEFGCATYQGAADKGARGGMIVQYDGGRPTRLDSDYTRDEGEQARYLCDLLDVFNEEGVDTALVCTFAQYNLPHRPDSRDDLDIASFGVVKVLENRRSRTYPDMPWEPKAAFTALAGYYGR